MQYNGQQIKWEQLVSLVEGDLGIQHDDATAEVGRLRVLSKITNDHLRLTPSLRMKVKLAAQVIWNILKFTYNIYPH